MSVITFRRAIVPASWPGGLGRPQVGSFDPQVQDRSWRYVPETYEEVCDWALVVKQGDDESSVWSTRALVYHPLVLPSNMRAQLRPVVLVLQGFLGDFNISPLGNWDKRDRSAPGAVQYLTLESGGVEDVFRAQVQALQHIRAFIRAKVGAELDEEVDLGDAIMLERSVFTKVRASGTQLPAVHLSHASDPGGRARKLGLEWRVDHVVQTGARRENGQNMAVAPTSFRQGDFVEVGVFAEIQYGRRQRRTGSIIKFAMKEVVRLWTAEDAEVSQLLRIENIHPSEEQVVQSGQLTGQMRAALSGGGS
ncbi:hypothetical protein C2E23DRAFT_869189 [Lenzites betulinus]|nr:hypothetical protein C2E23DRAFT_869189 [Lenzites betulinus]